MGNTVKMYKDGLFRSIPSVLVPDYKLRGYVLAADMEPKVITAQAAEKLPKKTPSK